MNTSTLVSEKEHFACISSIRQQGGVLKIVSNLQGFSDKCLRESYKVCSSVS
jgi:hypothetical protein